MKFTWLKLVVAAAGLLLQPARGQQSGSATANAQVDPIVKASPYGDKSTWSYSNFDSQPIPWAIFKPNDFSSVPVAFDSSGIRSVGQVPAPGIHPRIFFSPQDVPALRERLESTAAGQAAWKNILAISNLLRLTYDEKADYAKPDWVKGDFGGIHGRFTELANLGGYHHPDYYSELAAGNQPTSHYDHFIGMAPVEGFRCLVEDDANAAHKLAAAIVTWVKLKQEQRAKVAKPIKEGEPPKLDIGYDGEYLALTYDFIYNWMTEDQKKFIHDELVLISAWHDNYGTFNNADNTRSNWATFSYWVVPAVAIEGEPGYNDLKVRGLYRGWRNFYSDSYFKSGAVFEGEGKSLQGVDSAAIFDRLAAKYGWQPLLAHPTLRNHYGSFTSLSLQPTLNKFVFFDMLGGVDQTALSTPVDLIVAHYAYPADKRIDFVYRAAVGDDYSRLPHRADWAWPMTVLSAIFATDYDPTNSPESLNLPNTFFCGQRAMMMTRSSWDKDATFLTMHVRGASGGHPYSDRNGIMLTGKGRSWVTIPNQDGQGWKCNTVLIDGREQSRSTPGRVVDFVDRPLATFMVGDAKYCWDWVWGGIGRTKDDKSITRADVMDGNVMIGPGWKLVEQSFNDFAYTKIRSGLLDLPMKFMPDWIAVDGILSPTTKGINMPVMKAFRTAGLVRGNRPYVLVVDDIQRNCLPSRYDWHLMLLPDLVQIKQSMTGALPDDIFLAGNKSMGAAGTLTAGEPALLIRRIDAQGNPTTTIESVNDQELPFQKGDKGNRTNLLTVSTRAVCPNYKFILYPFLGGEPLPATTWNAAHTQIIVAFPDQQDTINFGVNRAGKTDLAITRKNQEIVRVSQLIPPLADPDTDELDQMLQKLPQVVPSLKSFNPQSIPGLVALWSFDEIKDGKFPAGESNVPGVPAGSNSSCVEGQIGKAARFPSSGIEVPLNLKESIKDSFTFSFWVKSDSDPTGVLINLNELNGFSLDMEGGSIRVNAQNKWYYGGKFNGLTITSWTHLAITGDGKTMVIYAMGCRSCLCPPINRLTLGAL